VAVGKSGGFDGVLNEELPPPIVDALAGRRQWLPRGAAIAAGIALLLTGAVAGWVVRGEVPLAGEDAAQVAQATPPIDTQVLMDRATQAHVVSADEDLRLAKTGGADDMGQYLSTRMGEQVRVPQLASLGYRLVGSRVLPDPDGPAAQFVFEEAGGERVTLYVRSEAASGVDITYALADDLSMFYWNDSEHSYAGRRFVDVLLERFRAFLRAGARARRRIRPRRAAESGEGRLPADYRVGRIPNGLPPHAEYVPA
jgi:anti-sigma factor RsiW